MIRFRIADITGQSLPICTRLLKIDALWGDLHIVRQGRSPMSYLVLVIKPSLVQS
jgi:hypothetical protein